MSISIIELHEIKLEARIGFYAWEKQTKQTLLIDLKFTYDTQATEATDHMENAIDYSLVMNSLVEFATVQHYQLLEKFTSEAIHFLFENFPLMQSIQLKVTKPVALAKTKGVSITMAKDKQEQTS